MKIIMRRVSVIFYSENHGNDNAVRRCLLDKIKAIPHNGASAFGERFCFKRKWGKWRNTGCISHFSHCTIGAKDPAKAAASMMRCCLNRRYGCRSRGSRKYGLPRDGRGDRTEPRGYSPVSLPPGPGPPRQRCRIRRRTA